MNGLEEPLKKKMLYCVIAINAGPFINTSAFCDQKRLFHIESNILRGSDCMTLSSLNTAVAPCLSQAVSFVNQLSVISGWIYLCLE
jgi:hypothetical protein